MAEDETPTTGEMGFSAAMSELEEILRRVESDEVDIDGLATELTRAAQLLELCRERVKKAEVEIEQIVDRLGDDDD